MTICTITGSVWPEPSIVLFQIARLYFPDSDYKIYLQDLSEEMLVKGNPLNEELKQEVLSVDGVTDIIVARQSLHTSIKTDANQNSGICDTLTDQNYAMVEAALTEGTMPTDSHSIVISGSIVDHYEDMGVGSTVEISFGEGQPSVPVTISGLFGPGTYTGQGKLGINGAVAFAPEVLFHELHPEITSFDYSWSIVSDPKKAETVKAGLKNIVASHSNLSLIHI